jgi:type I restriction enzyme, R subunit
VGRRPACRKCAEAQRQRERAFEGYRKRIIEIVSALESLANIPLVAAQLPLILEAQTDEYWQDVTPPILEQLRKRLRGLIGLIEKGKRTHIYTDFEDEIGPHSEIAIRGVGPGLDAVKFRDKALFCLRGHLDHIAVQKARRNEPLLAILILSVGRPIAAPRSAEFSSDRG